MEMHVHKQPLDNNGMVKRIEHPSLAHFPTRYDKEEVQLQGKELFMSQLRGHDWLPSCPFTLR